MNRGVISPPQYSPGYAASRFYPPIPGLVTASTTAVATLDTVVYLIPAIIRKPVAIATLNARVVTGAGSSAVKLALWRNNEATMRPTGVPVAGSNTEQATTGSASDATVAAAYSLAQGMWWLGAAFTTAAPTMVSVATANTTMSALLGITTIVNATMTGLSAPYTYATDIMTLDLTAASFTVITAAGIPIIYLGT